MKIFSKILIFNLFLLIGFASNLNAVKFDQERDVVDSIIATVFCEMNRETEKHKKLFDLVHNKFNYLTAISIIIAGNRPMLTIETLRHIHEEVAAFRQSIGNFKDSLKNFEKVLKSLIEFDENLAKLPISVVGSNMSLYQASFGAEELIRDSEDLEELLADEVPDVLTIISDYIRHE